MSVEITDSSFETSFESVIVLSDGTGGTTDHAELTNRDADDQHPISAITGLQEALDRKSELDLTVEAVTLDAGSEATATLADSKLTLGIPRGADGTVAFDDLTDEQKESLRGEKGDTGEQGEQGPAGADGADGAAGTDGVGISDITRTAGTGEAGTTDTYTITLTDGNTAEFTVYNGADGSGGSGSTGADGVGIQSIELVSGDGSAGSTDVYRITLTDGNTSEFTVYNGKDGADGVSPHIGDNGNWYVGDTDTGVAAQGELGITTVENAEVYSTEETVVGTWIDGKPVYRRTHIVTLSSWSSGASVDTGIDVSGLELLRKDAMGVMDQTSDLSAISTIFPDMWAKSTSSGDTLYVMQTLSTKLDLLTLYITLEYTKTTDEATVSATALMESYDEGVNEA